MGALGKTMATTTKGYAQIDVLLTILHVMEGASRQVLAEEIGVGEGTMRSVLDLLKSQGVIASSPNGHSLTQKGEQVLSKISMVLKTARPVTTIFYTDLKQFALVVAGDAKAGIQARDEAIRHQAKAALVLVKKGHLKAPTFEMDFSSIEQQFELDEGDVVVVTYADSLIHAKRSAIAVALFISEELNNMISGLSNSD